VGGFYNGMNERIDHLLESYVRYYGTNRGVGHTTATIQGAKKSKAIVLCHSEQYARELNNSKGVITLKYTEADRLRGHTSPILWDNAAIQDIFSHSLERIRHLDKFLRESTFRHRVAEAALEKTQTQLSALVKAQPKTTWQFVKATFKSLFTSIRTHLHG
jgi:hypothetical protein